MAILPCLLFGSLQTPEDPSLIKKSICNPNNLSETGMFLYGLPDREPTPSSVLPVTSQVSSQDPSWALLTQAVSLSKNNCPTLLNLETWIWWAITSKGRVLSIQGVWLGQILNFVWLIPSVSFMKWAPVIPSPLGIPWLLQWVCYTSHRHRQQYESFCLLYSITLYRWSSGLQRKCLWQAVLFTVIDAMRYKLRGSAKYLLFSSLFFFSFFLCLLIEWCSRVHF